MQHPEPEQVHLRNQRHRPQALKYAERELMLEALRARGEIRWVAHGHSMSPSIPSGSLVTIKRCDPHKLNRGEVILCTVGLVHEPHPLDSIDQSDGEEAWVLHRIIKHERDQKIITTRGDLTPHSDAPWVYTQVLGVLSAVAVESRYVGLRGFRDLSGGDGESVGGSVRGLFRGLFKRALFELIRWAHRRNPRSMLSRSLGLCIVALYPRYHRFKYPPDA